MNGKILVSLMRKDKYKKTYEFCIILPDNHTLFRAFSIMKSIGYFLSREELWRLVEMKDMQDMMSSFHDTGMLNSSVVFLKNTYDYDSEALGIALKLLRKYYEETGKIFLLDKTIGFTSGYKQGKVSVSAWFRDLGNLTTFMNIMIGKKVVEKSINFTVHLPLSEKYRTKYGRIAYTKNSKKINHFEVNFIRNNGRLGTVRGKGKKEFFRHCAGMKNVVGTTFYTPIGLKEIEFFNHQYEMFLKGIKEELRPFLWKDAVFRKILVEEQTHFPDIL